jgi:type IV pilus assembly protein PilC
MPTTYRYRARDRAGKLVAGKGSFETEEEARSFLRANRLMTLDLKAEKGGGGIGGLRREWVQQHRRIDLVPVIRQLAIMLKTGVPLDRTFEVLLDQEHPTPLAKALQQAARDVHSGSSLSEALERHPRVFPDLLVSLIRAGETGGVLDRSLDEAARQLVWQRELRQKVITAMTYPVFTLIMTFVMVSAMLLFVVPNFVKIYQQARVELPWPTQMLLNASHFMTTKGLLLIPLAAFAWWLFNRYASTTHGRRRLDRLWLNLPVLGPTFRKIAVANFCRTLGMLMDAGVAILECLRVAADASGNLVIKEAVHRVSEEVTRGFLLAVPLERSGEFPPLVVKLVAVGEMTGVLPEVLSEIVHVYSVEVDEEIKRAVGLMEPIMVLFLATVIGMLLTALYYPILNISKVATGG